MISVGDSKGVFSTQAPKPQTTPVASGNTPPDYNPYLQPDVCDFRAGEKNSCIIVAANGRRN